MTPTLLLYFLTRASRVSILFVLLSPSSVFHYSWLHPYPSQGDHTLLREMMILDHTSLKEYTLFKRHDTFCSETTLASRDHNFTLHPKLTSLIPSKPHPFSPLSCRTCAVASQPFSMHTRTEEDWMSIRSATAPPSCMSWASCAPQPLSCTADR